MSRLALVFLKYWFDLACAKDPAGIMLNSIDSAEEQQFCWNPENPGLDPNEAKMLAEDEEGGVLKGQGAEQWVWHVQGLCALPSSCICCQCWGRAWGMLRDSTVPPACAKRDREPWHCLPEQPASSSYTWLPRKLNEMKRRSIAFCFEVLNLSFPVSPAGTKLTEWRQSAWFSWYPTAVTILLPELLTHAAMQQESYFSMKSLEERFIALQKSSTEPFNVFAKWALQCWGCFTMGMGWFVAVHRDRQNSDSKPTVKRSLTQQEVISKKYVYTHIKIYFKYI